MAPSIRVNNIKPIDCNPTTIPGQLGISLLSTTLKKKSRVPKVLDNLVINPLNSVSEVCINCDICIICVKGS